MRFADRSLLLVCAVAYEHSHRSKFVHGTDNPRCNDSVLQKRRLGAAFRRLVHRHPCTDLDSPTTTVCDERVDTANGIRIEFS